MWSNGKVEYVRVDLGRFTTHYQNYYDCEWNFKEFRTSYPNYMDEKIDKPKNFEEMLAIANKLAEGFPHVRVDLYNVNGKIYFGELTFFVSSGFFYFIQMSMIFLGERCLNCLNLISIWNY